MIESKISGAIKIVPYESETATTLRPFRIKHSLRFAGGREAPTSHKKKRGHLPTQNRI
ncbi:MAG: hypothetical protein PHQ60_12965 [Sideroxydans sp.]|nr:hypothetical protein [Sideroxydans sp.]